jgi:uncharacterized protein (DUF486 family)
MNAEYAVTSRNVVYYRDGLNLSTNETIISLISWGIALLENLVEAGLLRNIYRILGNFGVRISILKTSQCAVF